MGCQYFNARLKQLFFEQLVVLGNRFIRLLTPLFVWIASDVFYEGALQNGVAAPERLDNSIDFLAPGIPVLI